jgi:hypothetical protein
MTGFTFLIEKTPEGQVHFDSCTVDRDGSEFERRLLGCIVTAVNSCVLQVSGHYKSKQPITQNDISKRALEVFHETLEQLRSDGKNPFDG